MKRLGLDNLILATGGADGITLTLTPNEWKREDGATVTSVYAAMKVDPGPGEVTVVDPQGALFNGQASWKLVRRYQWAIFLWDGEAGGWDVLANQSQPSVTSKAASSDALSSQPLTQ